MNADVQSGLPCRCGRWQHRATRAFHAVGIPAIPGGYVYMAEERHCPKCGNTGARRFGSSGAYLLLFRVEFVPVRVVPVGLAPLHGCGTDAMRRSLAEIRHSHPEEAGLTEVAMEAILASALLWAGRPAEAA